MNLHHTIINATPMAMRRGHYVVHNHDHSHTSGGGVWGLVIVGAVLLFIAGFIALRVMMNADTSSTVPAPHVATSPSSSGGGEGGAATGGSASP